ncbi:MAG: PAS domain-containing protein [Magnetospirillum sp.]|nr:PAS domain-containing protein [Magnetospirillum sp.]
MSPSRFGLISRIALLVVAIEIAAFSALGWFYISRFSAAAEDRVRSRLHMVGQMVSRNELAVSAIASRGMVGDLVGAPYLNGMVIGGSGRVIVSTEPALLGRPAAAIPGFDAEWLAESAPDHQIVAGAGTLTSITHVHGGVGGAPVYAAALTISTAELEAQKQSIALRGWLVSALFVLFSSAAIILVAQRLITRRVDTSLAVLKRVEGGALNARIPVPYDDELGQLQYGINSMTSTVGALLNQHRRNEEEISTILDAIADGVIAVGTDGNVLRCNPSAAAILGQGDHARIQGPIADLLPELPLGQEQPWWRAPDSLTASGRIHFQRPGPGGTRRSIEPGPRPHPRPRRHGDRRRAGGAGRHRPPPRRTGTARRGGAADGVQFRAWSASPTWPRTICRSRCAPSPRSPSCWNAGWATRCRPRIRRISASW